MADYEREPYSDAEAAVVARIHRMTDRAIVPIDAGAVAAVAIGTPRRTSWQWGWSAPRVLVVLAVVVALTIITAVASLGNAPKPLVSVPTEPRPSGRIAYQEGSAIYLARPDGSDRLELSGAVPFARLPVFSPDGRRVAFVAPSSAGAMGGRLLIVPIDGGGSPIEASHGIDLLASDVPQMSWSRDGKLIAFSARANGVATIFVAPSDGSQAPVPITDSGADRDLPTWSPKGDWLGFREKDLDGIRTRLQQATPDGSEVQGVATVIAADGYLSKPRWTVAEPRWINDTYPTAYWWNGGFNSDTQAYIDLGGYSRNVPWSGAPGGLADFGLPWSPDGKQLVILTRDEGVIVADYDPTEPYNGRLRRLGPVAACWVDWSPDGTALYGGSPDGCNGVVEIPLSDPGAAITVPGSTAGVASWQPLAR